MRKRLGGFWQGTDEDYLERFGRLSDEFPWGDRVLQGMAQYAVETAHMQPFMRRFGWYGAEHFGCGAFRKPLPFCEKGANQSPSGDEVSGSNPGYPDYPCFYIWDPRDQQLWMACLAQLVRMCKMWRVHPERMTPAEGPVIDEVRNRLTAPGPRALPAAPLQQRGGPPQQRGRPGSSADGAPRSSGAAAVLDVTPSGTRTPADSDEVDMHTGSTVTGDWLVEGLTREMAEVELVDDDWEMLD